jgi:hypothetical protein
MRRLLLLTCGALFVLASVSPAQGALTVARTAGAVSLELKGGAGYASISERGAVLGRMRRGRIVVRHLSSGAAPSGFVRGCEWRRGRLSGTLKCRGRDLRFYIHDGAWRVRLRGRGIHASGVVRGYLVLDDGTAGTYSIAGGTARRWPATWTRIALG